MKSQWYKSIFTIHSSSVGHKIVNGLIHRSECFAIETGNARVTHLPTGLLISPAGFTFKQAKAYAEKLAAMPFDWRTLKDASAEQIDGKPLREIIWKAVADIQEAA